MNTNELAMELTPKKARQLLERCRAFWAASEEMLHEVHDRKRFLEIVEFRETLASLVVKLHAIATAPTQDAGLYLVH